MYINNFSNMKNFDDLFRLSEDDKSTMLEKYEAQTAKKIRQKFKRFVNKLKKKDAERFRNLLDMLAHPEKRTPLVENNPHLIDEEPYNRMTDFDLQMYFHMIGKGGYNAEFELDLFNYWMEYAIYQLDMEEDLATKLYKIYKDDIKEWADKYLHTLAEECDVEIRKSLFGWHVGCKSKNTIRFGIMAEAED